MAGSHAATSAAIGSTRARVVGVDATRALALLGMVAVSSLWAFDAQGDVTWTYSLAAGRSAATFAVLGGVAITFLTQRRQMRVPDVRSVVASLTAHALVIGSIGLALGYADPGVTAVILAYYAVLFLLAIPLTFLSTRMLVVTGLVIAVVVPVGSHLVRGELSAPSDRSPSFGYLVDDPGGLVLDLLLTGTYPALPWTALLCTGMAVGRLRLSSRHVLVRLLGTGIVTAVVASALSWLALGPLGGREQLDASAATSGTTSADVSDTLVWGAGGPVEPSTWWWLTTTAPYSATPLEILHNAGVAVALLSAVLLLTHLGTVPTQLLAPLAAVGSMPLTLYTAHVVFVNSPLDVFAATTGFLVQVAVALVFALLWSRIFDDGPLERLVSLAARGARQLVTPPPARVLPHRAHPGRRGPDAGPDEQHRASPR